MRKLLLLGAILLGACGQSMQAGAADPVSLTVDPASVEAGGSIELVLHNDAAEEVSYNLCTSALERRTETGWEAVPSDRVCTMELRMLDAGEQASFTLELPPGLPPGEYRAVTNVGMNAAEETGPVRSGTFQVTS